MSRIFQFRHAARMLAARAGPGVCIGTGYVLTATPIRLDAAAPATTARPPSRRTLISPQAVKQIARGSFAGFAVGLAVALFSRTLVSLGSIVALALYVAGRYGIDIAQMLGIKKYIHSPAWRRRLQQCPLFLTSFTITFGLAAFARL